MKSDESPREKMRTVERAVYYLDKDYLGVWRRLLIDFVDTLVALFVSVGLTLFAIYIPTADEVQTLSSLGAWTFVWLGYFVFLKGSRYRTVGYVLARARIVNLRGERPSRFALFGRLMFVLLGPFNFIVDLLWISSDPYRQALRDKFAHTFVVRNDAMPAGAGRIAYRMYTLFGMTMLFAEVKPDISGAPA